MTEIDRALTDPAFFVDNDPHPLWAELRRKDPVHWTQGLVRPFWSITRYDDIVAAFAEPTLFSSEKGVLTVPSSPEMEQITPEMMGAGQMMIMTDPTLHTAMRRAFNRLFLPRAVGKYASPGAASAISWSMSRRGCRWPLSARSWASRARTGPTCSNGGTCRSASRTRSTRS